jgi:hypothetical protein
MAVGIGYMKELGLEGRVIFESVLNKDCVTQYFIFKKWDGEA